MVTLALSGRPSKLEVPISSLSTATRLGKGSGLFQLNADLPVSPISISRVI